MPFLIKIGNVVRKQNRFSFFPDVRFSWIILLIKARKEKKRLKTAASFKGNVQIKIKKYNLY